LQSRGATGRFYIGSSDGDGDAAARALSCALPVLQLAGPERLMSKVDETSPTLGELINQVRAAAKDGRHLDIGFPPDFTNTPFIAIAHKIATNSIDEFLAVERTAAITEDQRNKLSRMIERRVAYLVYSLAAPGPRTWDYPIGDPPPYA
jgi:hypothetical protein